MHRFTWWFQLRFHLLLALFSSNLEEEQISGSVTFFIRTVRPAMSTNQIGKHINIFVAAQKTKTLSLSLSPNSWSKVQSPGLHSLQELWCLVKIPLLPRRFPHCTAKRLLPGLVNFFPAVVYLFCLNLPAAFMQTGQSLSSNPCVSGSQ